MKNFFKSTSRVRLFNLALIAGLAAFSTACEKRTLRVQGAVNNDVALTNNFPQSPNTGGINTGESLVPIPTSMSQVSFGGPFVQPTPTPTPTQLPAGATPAPATPTPTPEIIPPQSYNRSPEALVAISLPPEFDFGEKQLGSTSNQLFIIANLGTGTAYGLDVRLGTGPFQISANLCPTQLAAMATCFVDVRFAPTQVGEFSDFIRLTYLQSSGQSGEAYRPVRGTVRPLPVTLGAGRYHSCAAVNGAAKCWGHNSQGQLGNGTTRKSPAPVDVSGLSSGVLKVGSGELFSCALVHPGSVKCWGYNGHGQLGDNTTRDRETPVQVIGLESGVTDLTVNYHQACAIQNGAAKCWGYNAHGQLGDSTNDRKKLPTQVVGLTSGVTAISTGLYHSCAVVNETVKCWGHNAHGVLGDNSGRDSRVPVDVSGLTSVTHISAGINHTCAIAAGVGKCWGYNAHGQLGNGSQVGSQIPVSVTGPTVAMTAISAGEYHTCGMFGSEARCWGYNGFGQLGLGNNTQFAAPVPVINLGFSPSAISAGWDHSCFGNGSSIKCTGFGHHGQLGDNAESHRDSPVPLYGTW